jgi:hypothetical protein
VRAEQPINERRSWNAKEMACDYALLTDSNATSLDSPPNDPVTNDLLPHGKPPISKQ